MDNSKKNIKQKKGKENNSKYINKDEAYSYDFVPTLNEWVNIDEQREKVKKLEDI